MEQYQVLNEKIQKGYQYAEQDKPKKACDEWLAVWEALKAILTEKGFDRLAPLNEEYEWAEHLLVFVQDLESELSNAGFKTKSYYKHRLALCQDMLELGRDTDPALLENFRSGLAQSQFELGNAKEAEQLYQNWLSEDPTWGWGYAGLAEVYLYAKKRTDALIQKAEQILTDALTRSDLRYRSQVQSRLLDLYFETGNKEKADALRKKLL